MPPLDEIQKGTCLLPSWNVYICMAYGIVWKNERGTCPSLVLAYGGGRKAHTPSLSCLDEDKWLPSVGTHFTFLFGRDDIPF